MLKAYANRAMGLISERITYPDSARRNQMEGRAVMLLTVDRRGRLTNLKMVEGTGHAPLDEAILAGARAVPNFGRLPEGYPDATLTFSAAIRFMLME
ncbi:energy transducer TonB [Thermaurantiacus sp.]